MQTWTLTTAALHRLSLQIAAEIATCNLGTDTILDRAGLSMPLFLFFYLGALHVADT